MYLNSKMITSTVKCNNTDKKYPLIYKKNYNNLLPFD